MATGIQISPPSGITIGTTAIDSGVDTRVLFQQGGVVQQDANFTFNNTQKRLTLKAVGTAATDIPFAVQNSTGTNNTFSVLGNGTTTVSNSMLEVEANDVTGIGYTRIRKITVGTFNKGSQISLFKNDNTNNIEIVRLEALSEGGITLFPETAGTKSVTIGNLVTGSNGGVSMYSTGVGTHNIQIANQFHNIFQVQGAGAQATFRVGNAGSNVNFFNVHGRNAGGTGLTTNPVFTINSSGTVGIGTEASTPGARLDVRAQGALSTDIAFRVRNSADTADIFSVRGNGEMYITKPAFQQTNTIYIAGSTDSILKYSDTAIGSIALGQGASISNASYYNTAIGVGATINVAVGFGIALGHSPVVSASGGIAIGDRARAMGTDSIVIGNTTGNTQYGGTNSIHIGKKGNEGNSIVPDNVFFTYFGDDNPSTVSRQNGSFGLLGQQAMILQNGTGIYGTDTFMGNGGNTLVVRNHPSVPSTNIVDSFQQYSADIVAGNAAPHFRTENGSIIKLYQETTAVASSTLVGGGGTTLTDTDTFDGYTLKQIVKALRNQGILA